LNAELLIKWGYQVDAAEDGAEGWDALHTRSYDLLITDNNMPKISGVELVRKVRSARMALPVIMASGARPAEELGLQLEAILLKPFTGEQLLGEVKRVLHEADMPRSRSSRCQSAKPSRVS
jgi:DNA-binding response OmpR family regulator